MVDRVHLVREVQQVARVQPWPLEVSRIAVVWLAGFLRWGEGVDLDQKVGDWPGQQVDMGGSGEEQGKGFEWDGKVG